MGSNVAISTYAVNVVTHTRHPSASQARNQQKPSRKDNVKLMITVHDTVTIMLLWYKLI